MWPLPGSAICWAGWGSACVVHAVVVLVAGGRGSLAGAFVAAMLRGLLQAFGAVWLPEASVLLPFMLMVGVLLWKPEGFAGSRT